MDTINDLLLYIDEVIKLYEMLYEENGQDNDIESSDMFYKLMQELEGISENLSSNYNIHKVVGKGSLIYFLENQTSYGNEIKNALQALKENYDRQIQGLELHRNRLSSFIEAF